ncbi:hypothetical protein J6590_103718, partial [Homalodisca vitripennis]
MYFENARIPREVLIFSKEKEGEKPDQVQVVISLSREPVLPVDWTGLASVWSGGRR